MADAMLDPDVLFRWPFARVLAVFFLDSFKERELSPAEVLERVNRKRAEKGLPPVERLASQGKRNG